MRYLMILLALGSFATEASLNHQPSAEALERLDRPRLEKEEMTLPEQRPTGEIKGEVVQEQQADESTEAQEVKATDQHGAVKKNNMDRSDSSILTPYGIK